MNWPSRRARWTAPLLVLPAAAVLWGPAAIAAGGQNGQNGQNSQAGSQAGIAVTGACSATAASFDATGKPLSQLSTNSGVAASSSAPLVVAYDGVVKYAARTPAIPSNTLTVSVAGVRVRSGRSGHVTAGKPAVGTVTVADHLPGSVTGLMKVDVTVAGAQGTVCTASTWVKLAGNGWTSVNGLLGVGLLVLALVGLVFSRGHRVRGALAGALAGLGVGMLLVSLSVIPLGTMWLPLVIVVAGAGVGLLFGKVTHVRGAAA